MKIHEYEAKEILKNYGIPIQDGFVITEPAQIETTVNTVAEQYKSTQATTI